MDTATHALLGGVIGASAGVLAPQGTEPLVVVAACALVATLPDSPLIAYRTRVPHPPRSYLWAHSIWPVIAIWFCVGPIYGAAYLSHILIDIPTHGPAWSARLFYPIRWHFACFEEWEWGNASWRNGLVITILLGFLWTFLNQI